MSELAIRNEAIGQEVMPSFDFLLEGESEKNALLAEHRAWLKDIKRERPLPKNHHRVAVYIRYFNQTRYEDYLSAHKKQFLDTLALCPNWEFIGFYVDEGSSVPNMESSPEWARLLQDSYEGKVDLIIAQTIRLLGNPAYVQFLVNPEELYITVLGSDKPILGGTANKVRLSDTTQQSVEFYSAILLSCCHIAPWVWGAGW